MRARCLPLVVLATLMALPASAAHASPAARDNAALLAGYRLLYNGDPAGAERYFHDASAKHPDDFGPAFGLLMAERARLDAEPDTTASFEHALDAFISRADDESGHRQDDGEALFYAAYGHLLRSVYKVEHNKGLLGAARDGAKAKDEISTYLGTHPGDDDAYLVRGMYDYWVDLAPTFAHVLRFLLFLPGGNRVEGLHDIERAAAHATLFAVPAGLQIIQIDGSFEGRPTDALNEAEHLHQTWPDNDDVSFALADMYASPTFEDHDRAATEYEAVIDRHAEDASIDGINARAKASLGLAGERFDAWRCQDAIDILDATITSAPASPDWILPEFLLERADYRMLMNEPRADEDARRVLATASMKAWQDDAKAMLKAIDDHRRAGDLQIYAALIPANRLATEKKWDDARRAYEAIAATHPHDPQVTYRLARVRFAEGDAEGARTTLATIAADGNAPHWLRAGAWLYVGRADDLAGRRDAARTAYQKVVDDYDQERSADAARIGLLTPYRRAQ